MSELAFFRLKSNSMFATEEEQHKYEVKAFTKDILRAKGIECDSKISRISQEQLEVIFQVRKLRKNKNEDDKDRQQQLDIAIQ
jgi:hypothetical protein